VKRPAQHGETRPESDTRADLRTNVEFDAVAVLDAVGLTPPQMFTPTFAASRMIGWMTHALEQAADSEITRPSSRHIGPVPGGRSAAA